jgi:glycerophosphoryl diester phosphodiesterase
MRRFLLIFAGAITGAIIYVAYKSRKVSTPQTYWKRFHQKGTKRLDAQTCNDLQGIYTITQGNEVFGDTTILKWTYTVEGKDTLYHISFFCEKDGTFIVCEGKRDGNEILLNGYWRQLDESETGTVWLTISANEAAKIDQNRFVISGVFGDDKQTPEKRITLHYQQPIPEKNNLQIIAHRGGARNMDFLPVSENSLAMFKMAARLGATGVEIDVRMTRDNIPVIVHDSFLSLQTFQNTFYGGLISNYTLEELKKETLKKGGTVPTLEESLNTILYNTPLNLIWLDIKKECDLTSIRKLQMDYLQKAKAIGRDLEIYIGIADEKMLECFQALPDHADVPSLTELDSPVAEKINANVWAPQYTKGFQKDEVLKMQQQGRKVFVWSLDEPAMIETYLKESNFNGIVTNACPVVFYTYYTEKDLVVK